MCEARGTMYTPPMLILVMQLPLCCCSLFPHTSQAFVAAPVNSALQNRNGISTPTRLKLPTHPHRLQHQKNHGALFSAAPPLPSMDFSFSSPEEEQQQAPPPAAAVDDAVENCTKKAAGAKRKKAGGRGGGPVGRALRRVLSFMTILTTTYLFRFLLQGLNKVTCRNHQGLLDAIFDRGDRGLLTVSNHNSVYDDPGLWSALVPIWRTGRDKMRWSMCTDDIYNANPSLRRILAAGKTLPIKRNRGMEQPFFQVFFDKLEEGDWGHIFAEGAIRQPWRFSKGEPMLGEFKAGIGRLLLRSKKLPMVLPMYHIGMHRVAPEAPVQKHGRGKLVKPLPNTGCEVLVYVGEPIDVRPIVEKCRAKIGDVRDLPWTLRSSKEEVACHKEIAEFIRGHVLKLEAIAREVYYGSDPSSPFFMGDENKGAHP